MNSCKEGTHLVKHYISTKQFIIQKLFLYYRITKYMLSS